jgi:outer membrane immunogenic protein
LLLFTGSAYSADIFGGPSVDRMLDSRPAEVWTGPYFGLTIGYGWADLEATRAFAEVTGGGSASLPLTGFTTSEDSFNGGLTAGYNFYTSGMVFGIEADASYGDFKYNSGPLAVTDVLVGGDTLSGNLEAGFDFFGTLRGRLGLLATPTTIIYGTAGLALARTKASGSFSYDDGTGPIAERFSDSNIEAGWTAGLGIEDRFTSNLSLKLEYLYVDLPNNTFTFSEPGVTIGFDGKADMHLLRTGLNYHF